MFKTDILRNEPGFRQKLIACSYFSQMGGTCGTYGRQERCIRGYGVETKGKRPLGRPRHRREYNVKMDLQDGWGGMKWIA